MMLLASPLARWALVGLILAGAAWWLRADGYRAGEAAVRAEMAAAVEDARRITDAALRAAEADKAAMREQMASAQKAAQRARGGVEKVGEEGKAALEAIR